MPAHKAAKTATLAVAAAAPEVPPALMAALADPAMVARMMCLLPTPLGVQITGPEGAAREAVRLLAGYDHERAAVIGLDARNRVVASDVLTVGNSKHCIMDAAQIYRWALSQDVVVSRIIVAHNHPSGDATPSDADIAVTRRIVQAGRHLGVPCIDHLIVAGADATSIREVRLDLFDAPAFDSCLT